MAESAIVTPTQDIPDKLYFRIGEVARLAGIKPYVLRFWESEFPSLGPKKSGTGHRLYRNQAPALRKTIHHRRRAQDARDTRQACRRSTAREIAQAHAIAEGRAERPLRRNLPGHRSGSSGVERDSRNPEIDFPRARDSKLFLRSADLLVVSQPSRRLVQ
jgi:DNA-binding transcriptional MerR regulator